MFQKFPKKYPKVRYIQTPASVNTGNLFLFLQSHTYTHKQQVNVKNSNRFSINHKNNTANFR